MYLRIVAVIGLALPLLASAADPVGSLDLPSFSHLQSKATEVVDVTLGTWPLALASKLMEADDPESREMKKVISGIKSIAIRSYEFDSDFVYSKDDVDAVRSQLTSSVWTRLAQVRKRNQVQEVDVYAALDDDRITGFAIIACEPRKFTILNIVGTIDLDQLAKLDRHIDLPHIALSEL
jgi:hypothetical protein